MIKNFMIKYLENRGMSVSINRELESDMSTALITPDKLLQDAKAKRLATKNLIDATKEIENGFKKEYGAVTLYYKDYNKSIGRELTKLGYKVKHYSTFMDVKMYDIFDKLYSD